MPAPATIFALVTLYAGNSSEPCGMTTFGSGNSQAVAIQVGKCSCYSGSSDNKHCTEAYKVMLSGPSRFQSFTLEHYGSEDGNIPIDCSGTPHTTDVFATGKCLPGFPMVLDGVAAASVQLVPDLDSPMPTIASQIYPNVPLGCDPVGDWGYVYNRPWPGCDGDGGTVQCSYAGQNVTYPQFHQHQFANCTGTIK